MRETPTLRMLLHDLKRTEPDPPAEFVNLDAEDPASNQQASEVVLYSKEDDRQSEGEESRIADLFKTMAEGFLDFMMRMDHITSEWE